MAKTFQRSTPGSRLYIGAADAAGGATLLFYRHQAYLRNGKRVALLDSPPQLAMLDAWRQQAGFFVFPAAAIAPKDLAPLEQNLAAYAESFGTFFENSGLLYTPAGAAGRNADLAALGARLLAPRRPDWRQLPRFTEPALSLAVPPISLPIPAGFSAWPAWDPAKGDFAGIVCGPAPPAAGLEANGWDERENLLFVDCGGDSPGTLRSRLLLHQVNEDGYRSWLAGFTSPTPFGTGATAATSDVFFPLFELDGRQLLSLRAVLRPFQPRASRLEFAGNPLVIATQPPPARLAWDTTADRVRLDTNPLNLALPERRVGLRTFFRDVCGRPLCLAPLPGARLLPAGTFLVPSGDFEVGTLGRLDARPCDLLCGIAGTEFVRLTPARVELPGEEHRPGDVVSFCPVTADQARDLSADPALRYAPRPDPKTPYASAWCRFKAGDGNDAPVYFAQPAGAAMFRHRPAAGPPPPEALLAAQELENARFTGLTPVLPLLPYAGALRPPAVAAADFFPGLRRQEQESLAHVRKNRVSRRPAGKGLELPAHLLQAGGAETWQTATPQGFLAEVIRPGSSYRSVTLTQLGTRKVAFERVDDPLRDALQSNQLFMVISQAAAGTFAGQLTLEEWPFDIEIPTAVKNAGELGNVLIFKFAAGRLADLVAAPGRWARKDDFNAKEVDVAGWIADYLEQAELAASQGAGGSYLQDFVDKVKNPAWMGVLALKVGVRVSDFPDQLAGLAAGIDLDRFWGHHLGFELNHVKSDQGKLSIENPSIFGLIHYVAKDAGGAAADPAQQGDYRFEVMDLQVIFEHCRVVNFAAKIHLTAHRFFGQAATLTKTTGISGFGLQSIELDGHLERHDGADLYTFTTRPGEVYRYALAGGLLQSLEVRQARFSTLAKQDGSPVTANGVITTEDRLATRFQLSGDLGFAASPDLDLFSYGDGAAGGLRFGNLAIAMDFKLVKTENTAQGEIQNRVAERRFTFAPQAISLDGAASKPRPGSLCDQFPLRVKRLVAGHGGGDRPASRGYLPLATSTGEAFAALGDEWYGLELDLDFGSPGALAAKLDFTTKILLAWGPGAGTTPGEVGIRLPGSGGAKKLLSVESVLKLSIDEMLLHRQGDGKDAALLLDFYNIALKFFGIKLPLAGSLGATLFGDPAGGSSSLGWYAGYSNLKKS